MTLSFLDDITAEELEQLTVSAIREYRQRLADAQALFEEIEAIPSDPHSEEFVRLRKDYHLAMVSQHATHQVVIVLIDALGHVPHVDDSDLRPHWCRSN